MSEERDVQDDALAMVAVAGPAEGQMIEELLRNNGIQSSLQGGVISTPLPSVSDLDEVRVFVDKKDAARAQELVDGFFTAVPKDELLEDSAELGVDDPNDPSGFTI